MARYPHLPAPRLLTEISRIMQITSKAPDLAGMKILDLGCGAIVSRDAPPEIIDSYIEKTQRDPHEVNRFRPWYCRILHEAGAEPVGIDIADNSKEEFETHCIDLSQPNALAVFEDNSFDAVNNFCLTVPPESKLARIGTSPSIMDEWMKDAEQPSREHLIRAWKLDLHIQSQVTRILRDRGIYTLAEFVLEKRNNQFHLRNKIDDISF